MKDRGSTTTVVSTYNFDRNNGRSQLLKQVLFNINLEIDRGEAVLIIGLSGSGKTTLLRLVSRLRSPK